MVCNVVSFDLVCDGVCGVECFVFWYAVGCSVCDLVCGVWYCVVLCGMLHGVVCSVVCGAMWCDMCFDV